jgi:hypothetical protein
MYRAETRGTEDTWYEGGRSVGINAGASKVDILLVVNHLERAQAEWMPARKLTPLAGRHKHKFRR